MRHSAALSFAILLGMTGLTRADLPVPAVYVLDAAGRVAATFGYPGSVGRECRSDHDDVPGGIRCQAEDPNPLQAALDYAARHGMRKVRLDAAEYTFPEPIRGWIGRIGFHVPSGIHLMGVMRDGEPASVLMPGPEIDPPGAPVPPPQQFEVLVMPAGDLTNRDAPLVDTTIEAVALNARLLGGVCLWAGGGSGFKLLRVQSHGSRQSSLIVGGWDDSRQDPEKPFRAVIHWMRDFEVAHNHVRGAHGDGICVIGINGHVHHNRCENGTTLVDNGITTFIGSSNIRFTDNLIVNFPTAIGLDGAFMPCRRLPGIDDPAKARDLCLEKLRALYQGWEGYHRGHEIAGNEIRNCRRGIVLHRATEIHIHGNRINGRGVGEGIALEEASANHVWNNRVRAFVTACTLYAHSHSAIAGDGTLSGASGNRIGLTPAGDVRGNDFRGNQRGIALIRADPAGRVAANTITANDCRDCPLPFDFNGGEDGPGGQSVADNLPADAQQALPAGKLSASPN